MARSINWRTPSATSASKALGLTVWRGQVLGCRCRDPGRFRRQLRAAIGPYGGDGAPNIRAEKGGSQLRRSTIMAMPWPPPTHMDSMP